MVRYNLFAWVTVTALILLSTGCQHAAASSDYGGLGMDIYGFPMDIVPTYAGAATEAGQGYTYNNIGYTLPDFASTYGFTAFENSPLLTGTTGYVGPDLGGIDLGVSFGLTQADHDASTTSFNKNLMYQADLDSTFIAFPGIGVGSLGVLFPTVRNDKSSVKYAESIQFEFSTESDKFQMAGFGYPLGLGLGYTSAMVGTNPSISNLLNSSAFVSA
jgi:hypothetical protein